MSATLLGCGLLFGLSGCGRIRSAVVSNGPVPAALSLTRALEIGPNSTAKEVRALTQD